MATATLVKCDICGKKCKPQGLKAHIRLAHPEEEGLPPVMKEGEVSPVFKDKRADIEDKKVVGKSIEDIARILYEDIVRQLCEENHIPVGEWDTIDHNDYLAVARKIKG